MLPLLLLVSKGCGNVIVAEKKFTIFEDEYLQFSQCSL